MLFDRVVSTILHVAVRDGFLTTYDVAKNCSRLKHRAVGGSSAMITSLCQIDGGRYELVCACLDGTVKFYDFDVNEAVQVVKMPPGCLLKGKLFVDVYQNKLVAGGCYMEADEVLLCMQMKDEEWVPVGSQLTNGV